MIFATAGHVDHGKTSLVKALTNVDTDRLKEEKARGLTIDLGFAYTEANNRRIGFVDVPGHAKFISNMLAGVASIDHGLLVIAADDGPMPQTVEHLAILQLLGIPAITVVVTKIDRVSDEHLANTQARISALLDQSPYPDATRFETSVETQQGIEALSQYLYSRQSNREKTEDQYFRLAIDRKFAVKGSGIVVTGSVFSGAVETGQDLLAFPQGKKVRVRGLHRQDSVSEKAETGDRCALNIAGDIELETIERGNWITSNPALPVSERLDVSLLLLPSEAAALRTGTSVHIHLGAQHTIGRVFLLEQRHVAPGEKAIAQLKLNAPLSSCSGDRFVIRDQSAQRTLGGGVVVDPISVKRGRSKSPRLAYLKQLLELQSKKPTAPENLDTLVKQATAGLDLQALFYSQNRPIEQTSFPVDARGFSHHSDALLATKETLYKAITTSDKTRQELTQATDATSALVDLALQELLSGAQIEQHQGRYTLANQKPTLSKAADTLWKKVEPILSQEPLQPPVISELAKRINLPPAALEKLLGECISQGLVVRPVKNRFFLASALQTLRLKAVEIANSHDGKFTVIQFRDASGLGRNLCIELLEHLDGKGFTKRMGDVRIIQDTNR